MKTLMCALFACSMAACAADDSAAPDDNAKSGTNEQSIIGGTTDTGDACVVAVFAHTPGVSSGSLCTGTIIGPHSVLTAAHCCSPSTIGTGQEIDILTGPTLTGPSFVASSAVVNGAWNLNNLFGCHDECIVHTAATLSPVCTLGALNSAATVRLVGYGTNTHQNGGAGTKRQVTTVVDALNNVVFQDGNSNAQTCHGDSGGPAFQGANVVGVTSFGSDPSPTDVCEGGGFHCRVDADLAFINANKN